MTKEDIIFFVKSFGCDNCYAFSEPINVKATPHSLTLKVTSLEIYEDDLQVHFAGGYDRYDLVTMMIKHSIIQRVKLIIFENDKRITDRPGAGNQS